MPLLKFSRRTYLIIFVCIKQLYGHKSFRKWSTPDKWIIVPLVYVLLSLRSQSSYSGMFFYQRMAVAVVGRGSYSEQCSSIVIKKTYLFLVNFCTKPFIFQSNPTYLPGVSRASSRHAVGSCYHRVLTADLTS